MTWNEFCLNISYKLNKDFAITLKNDFYDLSGTILELNMNEFNGKEIEVREILTKYDGLCYTLLNNFTLDTTNYFQLSISAKVWIRIYIFLYIHLGPEIDCPELN